MTNLLFSALPLPVPVVFESAAVSRTAAPQLYLSHTAAAPSQFLFSHFPDLRAVSAPFRSMPFHCPTVPSWSGTHCLAPPALFADAPAVPCLTDRILFSALFLLFGAASHGGLTHPAPSA